MLIAYWEIALRLFLAVVFGGAVGFERESHNRPAGFRTHILVCSGSALIMMVSAYGFSGQYGPGFEVDPSRIAAGVVTGIGFLGAGTILQHRGSVRGLTTAASIWVVSGIGLAIGIGFYLGAFVTTVFVLISLFMLRRTEKIYFERRRLKQLEIIAVDQPGLLGRIGTILGDFEVHIRKNEIGDSVLQGAERDALITLDFLVEVPPELDLKKLFEKLLQLESVIELAWQHETIKRDANGNFLQL
jgi:putative Mg2+ transporter-C (MgtC) family protein